MSEGVLESHPPDALFIVRKQVEGYPDVFDSVRRMANIGILRGGTTLEISPTAPDQEVTGVWRHVIEKVRQRRTELVVLHHFHSDRLPDISSYIRELRSLPHRPVVAITNGDAYFRGLFRPRFPATFLSAARAADAVFTTSMGVAGDYLYRETGSRIALLPHGVCQVRFDGRYLPPLSSQEPDFRVIIIGNHNRSRKPWSPYYWYGRKRERVVNELGKKFGSDFAIFGRGWEGFPNWHGPVAFSEQQLTCRRAEVVVGGVPYSPARYYTSDRPYIQIASGIPFVDLDVEGVGTLLRDGEHWHLAGSVDRIVDICDELLSTPRPARIESGMDSMKYLLEQHRVVDRCESLVRSLVALRQSIIEGAAPPAPDLSHLLSDVSLAHELPYATRGWVENESA